MLKFEEDNPNFPVPQLNLEEEEKYENSERSSNSENVLKSNQNSQTASVLPMIPAEYQDHPQEDDLSIA